MKNMPHYFKSRVHRKVGRISYMLAICLLLFAACRDKKQSVCFSVRAEKDAEKKAAFPKSKDIFFQTSDTLKYGSFTMDYAVLSIHNQSDSTIYFGSRIDSVSYINVHVYIDKVFSAGTRESKIKTTIHHIEPGGKADYYLVYEKDYIKNRKSIKLDYFKFYDRFYTSPYVNNSHASKDYYEASFNVKNSEVMLADTCIILGEKSISRE